MLSSVCGIKPADIGFNTVTIEPHPGTLTSLKASMPHPKGRISVEYKIAQGKLNASIGLPKGMSGTWKFKGQSVTLYEGINKIKQDLSYE
jgi:hypothetical protein